MKSSNSLEKSLYKLSDSSLSITKKDGGYFDVDQFKDIEKIKECNGISDEKIKNMPLPSVQKVKLIGDNLEFTSTMPRIKLDIPKRQKSKGFINIGTILLLITIVVCIILTNR